MSRLIDADKLIEDLEGKKKELLKQLEYDLTEHQSIVFDVQINRINLIIEIINNQPTAFDVEKVIGQYKWERDIAMYQLEKLGIGFGQKLEDEVIKKVKEVMKCD